MCFTNYPPHLSDLRAVGTSARQLRSSCDSSVLRRSSVLWSKVLRILRLFYFILNSLRPHVRPSEHACTFRSQPETHISALPINLLNVSVTYFTFIICVFQSFISCVVGWVGVLSICCQCFVTLTMCCDNVFVICNHMIETGYVLNGENNVTDTV